MPQSSLGWVVSLWTFLDCSSSAPRISCLRTEHDPTRADCALPGPDGADFTLVRCQVCEYNQVGRGEEEQEATQQSPGSFGGGGKGR